jgi:hypothetical protein
LPIRPIILGSLNVRRIEDAEQCGFGLSIEGHLRQYRIVTFPVGENQAESLQDVQAHDRLCFDDSESSSKSWIAFEVIAILRYVK